MHIWLTTAIQRVFELYECFLVVVVFIINTTTNLIISALILISDYRRIQQLREFSSTSSLWCCDKTYTRQMTSSCTRPYSKSDTRWETDDKFYRRPDHAWLHVRYTSALATPNKTVYTDDHYSVISLPSIMSIRNAAAASPFISNVG